MRLSDLLLASVDEGLEPMAAIENALESHSRQGVSEILEVQTMKSEKKRTNSKPNPEGLVALMEKWPTSWAGLKEDEAPGARLVAELRPFIVQLVEQDLSAKTVRRHLDNLWVIGGEIVRSFNDEPKLRHEPTRQLLLKTVEIAEAPLLQHATEAQQRSADATARKLLKFLLLKEVPRPS